MVASRIPVAILGATGAVGQRFVQLLWNHPWFEITGLAASDRSTGQPYRDACNWVIPGDPPPELGDMIVSPIEPSLTARIVFSALPAAVASEAEPAFARRGYTVCSNASTYRCAPDVPLIIPELNADHLALIDVQRRQRSWSGMIVTSPNCTTTGIAIPLKALDTAFGVRKVFVTSMQAISGAGYPGIPSLDILDNVVPYVGGEEEKIEKELTLLLGQMAAGQRRPAPFVVSAHANRVPVLDGHTVCMSLGFTDPPSVEDAMAALSGFSGPDIVKQLPSAPELPIVLRTEVDRPQPRRDRDAQGGMAVTVGRIRTCPLLDLRLVSVVHNTLRGAASGAILNAELLIAAGYIR
ncbi:MAG: aspartate-semialdehyde dehydrogenase [Chloroflexi bacterium]|nr:aspartate-semialdehyde dehydrogenase [Chloroflexota bacterium]